MRFLPLLVLLVAGPALADGPAVKPVTPAEFRSELDARRDRVLLVNFWATWCRPCLKELPELLALEQKYAGRGLQLVAVSLDEPADRETVVRPFLGKWFPALSTLTRRSPAMDDLVSVVDPAWNEVLPTSYVVDRSGTVRARLQGGKTTAEFEAAIVPLLSQP
jgi:thiol-disulfide isomerase/thioredoxin